MPTTTTPIASDHQTRPPFALSEGAALPEIPGQLANLPDALKAAAREPGNKGINYLNQGGSGISQSYAALLEEAQRILGGLRRLGLKPGDKVIFLFDLNQDFIPALWGCELGGFVPVPLSVPPGWEQPHSALSKLQNAWHMLEKPLVLCGDVNVNALSGWAQRSGLEGFRAAGIGPLRTADSDPAWHRAGLDDLALLLLTSGSTGQPKGVTLTHRNLLGRSAGTAQINGFTPADISLNWMPLDHVGGVVMYHIQDIFNRCSQIHAPTETILRRPLQWLDWIHQFRVTNTWAPNFAFGLINDQAAELAGQPWDLSCLRFILNGGEAIVCKTARDFLKLLAPYRLPATAMHPSWGMSETSSGITFSDRLTLDATSDADSFVEVGTPIPGAAVRIVDARNELLREGEIGRLQVRGLPITSAYYNNPQLNAEVFTADGWFNTGDLGRLRAGCLTITGREKDVIIVNGINFYSHEIESVVEGIDGVEVSFTAACPIRIAGEDTDRLAIFFHPSEDAGRPELLRTIRARVLQEIGLTPDYLVALSKDAIPKTAIGKIQRAQLKQQYEAGEFDSLREPKSSGNLPDWFYKTTWFETAGRPGLVIPAGCSLLFADHSGLGAELERALAKAGNRCVHIEPGPQFARLSASHYQIAAEDPQDYLKLLASVTLDHPQVTSAIHLWTFTKEAREPASVAELEGAQALGTYSILALVQALVLHQTAESPIRLLVASSFSSCAETTDRIAYEKVPVVGLVRTIPHELPWLRATHLDLPFDATSENARLILAELAQEEEGVEVAYRQGRRLVSHIEKVNPDAVSQGQIPFKSGGMYLLSGGLGGIGLEIAKHLAQHYRARLLIIGRSDLNAERQGEIKSLEALGGGIIYRALDISDLSAVRAAFEEAKAHWQCDLDGVLHLAGVYHEALLAEETREGFTAVLRPKISGAWVLHQLAKDRPGCLFLNFSSLISFFGSLSTGAYAAANSFLDSFAHFQRHQSSLRSYSLLWSSWTNTGMSRGYDATQALLSRGYLPISIEQGLNSLLFALKSDAVQLAIGLDGNNKNLQRYLYGNAAGADPTPAEIPRMDYVAPRTEVERQIARIWEGLLGVQQVGIKDNFFELGGRSLLAARMFSQIQKVMGKNLPIPALFRAPTVEQLAQMIEEQAPRSPCKVLDLPGGGTSPPLFFFPAAGDDGKSFGELAQHCGDDRRCYALQVRGLDTARTEAGLTINVGENVAFFVKEIRARQPKGPYFLASHCFGSLLACEVARQLISEGEKIGTLALIDPLVDDFIPAQYKASPGNGSGSKPGFGTMLRSLFGSGQDKLPAGLARMQRHYAAFQLAPYPGSLTLITATPAGKSPRAAWWERLAPNSFTQVQVDGDHESLLRAPAVVRVAQILRDRCISSGSNPPAAGK